MNVGPAQSPPSTISKTIDKSEKKDWEQELDDQNAFEPD